MSRATRRAPLTRDRILAAALEHADAHGIEALKMRDLARALGFEAMALYRHVVNKDEILEGILDLVLSEVEQLPASAAWADAIRHSAISLHEALERHPWAAGLLTTPVGLRTGRLRLAEALLTRLEEAGFGDDAIFHAYHVLDAHVIGYSLWLAGHSLTADERTVVAERFAREVSSQDYPRLRRHRDRHREAGPHQNVSGFELGLDLILGGLKKSLG